MGWVPFVLESLDEYFLRYKPWVSRPDRWTDELPSEVFKRQIFVNTWFEGYRPGYPYANAMFETDYPHPKCLLGSEITDAIGKLSSLEPELLEDVLWRNAMRCFRLQPGDVVSDEEIGQR
jgi:hypothetical protein